VTARPVYARVLQLRHLRLRPWSAFLLFEGSVGLAILLAFAEIINAWGVLAVPLAVAAAVKLNDVVAGALERPLAIAGLRGPAVLAAATAQGASDAVRHEMLDGSTVPLDQVASAHYEPGQVARGVASVSPAGSTARRPPMPGGLEPEPPIADALPIEVHQPGTTTPAPPHAIRRRCRANKGRFLR
jgi:hypothetical protein